MLTRLRDEAHRFAITFQQKLMRRRNFQSVLEDIPGVGEGRKKALLAALRLAQADPRGDASRSSREVEGSGPAVAERIHAHLHGRRDAPRSRTVDEDAVREASLEDATPRRTAAEGRRPSRA